MPERYLAWHPEAGVFLGACMGMGFWSKWDPVGQDHAPTFAKPSDVQEYINSWDDPDSMPGVEVKRVLCGAPVNHEGSCYATIAECVEAGCEPWKPDNVDEEDDSG